jgi:DNA repair exonuclease SbcCD ATPase subunit
VKLTHLEIDNFLSVKKARTELNDKGLVLIRGNNEDEDTFDSNGAGKSTTFSEAPTWCLFGETIRGHKGDKVCNRDTKNNTRVAMGLLDDNGDKYEIIRHRKHKTHKNHVLLFRNGDNITGKSDTDTNNAIIELLQMDFVTFTNSIMFGQGMNKMFAMATDSEQKKVLEQMLQIDIFRACQDRAKQYAADLQKQKDLALNYIRMRNDKKVVLLRTIDELEVKEAELGEKVAEKIAVLIEERDSYVQKIAELEEIGDIEDDIKYLQGILQKLSAKLSEYDDFITKRNQIEGEERSLKREYDGLERKLASTIQNLRDIKIGKNIPKNCAECGQPLPQEDTSRIESHLGSAIEKLELDCERKMNELTEIRDLINQVNEHLQGREVYVNNSKELQDEIRNMEERIRTVRTAEKSYTKLILSIDKQIKEQEDLRNTTYMEIISETSGHIEVINLELDKKQTELEGIDSELELYNFWVNSFSNQGIKSVLLDSVTPYLNTRANHYLTKMTGASIEVRFNTQDTLKSGEKRDKFKIEVINEHGDDNYTGNSGGEKRRIDIAINMALQDLVSSRSNKALDIVVYDECYEGLDEIGCQSVIELLQEKAETFGSVFVITHNDSLKQMFTKSMVVTKEGGETTIHEESV